MAEDKKDCFYYGYDAKSGWSTCDNLITMNNRTSMVVFDCDKCEQYTPIEKKEDRNKISVQGNPKWFCGSEVEQLQSITPTAKNFIIKKMIMNWMSDKGIQKKPSDQRAFLEKLLEVIDL